MESSEENNTVATYGRTYGRHACNAWNCKNRQRNKYSNGSLLVHRFPQEPERCKEWLLRAGREDLMDKPVLFISSNLSLCSEHFEPHCYYKKNKLQSDALPTIFNTSQSNASSCRPSEYDSLEQAEYLSNDHVYCKTSPLSDGERMEVDEVVSEDIQDTYVSEEHKFSQNSVNDYLPHMEEVNTSQEEMENTLIEKSNEKLMGIEDAVKNEVPDGLLQEEEQQTSPNVIQGSVSIDDVRSLSIQPFTESVFSWEKISDQICRLCATKNELHPKQSIVRWLGLLNEIVPGMVALDDGLPQHVCKPCLKKLYTAIRIKVEFTEADEKLQDDMGFIKSSNVVLKYEEKNVCESDIQTDTKLTEDVLHTSDLQLKHDLHLQEEVRRKELDNSDEKLLETEVKISNEYKMVDEDNDFDDDDDDDDDDESLETEMSLSEYNETGDESNDFDDDDDDDSIESEISFAGNSEMGNESNNLDEESLASETNISKDLRIPDETVYFSNQAAKGTENYYIDNNVVRNKANFVTSAHGTNCYVNKEGSVTLQSENLIGHKRVCYKVNNIVAPIKSYETAKSNTQLYGFEYVECEEGTSSKHRVKIKIPVLRSEKKLKYNCIKCGKTFLSEARLKAHKLEHKKLRRAEELTCKICNGQFLFKRDLILHIGTHYNGKPYGCEQCGNRYRSIFRLKTHKMYHFPPTFSCSKCGKKFHLQSVLDSHMKSHSEKSKFICNVCGKSLSSESILEGHLRMHEGLKPFQCHLCGKCYQSFDCLRFHKLRHRGARFFCEICGKGTKDKTAMKAHMNTHTKELACKCPICLKTFANSNSRAKHLKQTCVTITCIVCGNIFETVEILEDHRMKEHSVEEIEKCAKECRNDSILYCEECCLYIAGMNKMENHMFKVHNMEDILKCKQCFKCFLSDDVLQEHVSSCTKERPRKLTDGGKCIICSEVLIGSNELMKHLRNVHKDYRPYLCDDCPKSFLTKKELEYHSTSHIKKKQNQCSKCDVSFTNIRALKCHELAQHPEYHKV